MSSSSKAPLKVVFIGSRRSGKTTIANFLSGHRARADENYRPTTVLRILEYEVASLGKQGSSESVAVELWDTCGDYNNCKNGWPAMLKGAAAYVFVASPESREVERDLEQWYKTLGIQATENQCLVILNCLTAESMRNKPKFGKPFSKFRLITSNIGHDAEGLRSEFENFLLSASGKR